MDALIAQAAEDMVNHLTQSNLAKIADYYSYPAAVYFDTNVIVLQSREELLQALGLYRGALRSRRLARIRTRVLQAPRIDRDRFTVTVSNVYHDHSGHDIGTSRIRFYVQREGECLKIRLVEYLDWPCAQELEENEHFQRLCAKGSMARSFGADGLERNLQLH